MGFFGWTLMSLGLFSLLLITLTSGDVWDRLAGTGDRRISRRAQLAQQRDRIAELEQQIAACPTCTPTEFPTDEQIAVADALAGPGLHVAALADNPAAWINQPDPLPVTNGPRAIDDTPAVAETYEPADLTAETQPVPQVELDEVLGLGDTQPIGLPAVSRIVPVLNDPLPPVTWRGVDLPAEPLADLAIGTAPGPMHEVPVGFGAKASLAVTTALDEAS